MNISQLEMFVEGYLSGFFRTVGFAISLDPTYNVDSVAEFSGESMALADTYQVAMGGAIAGGGRIYLLMKAEDAYRITAAVAEVDLVPKSAIDHAELPQLAQALEACTRFGARYFKETYGNPVEFESVVIAPLTQHALQEFQAAGPGIVADFTFGIPNVAHSKGALLVSEILGSAVAGDVVEPPSLTKDEVDDILSEFDDTDVDQESGMAANVNGASADVAMPERMGRVLDIQLTVTARLGRIEMPIQDILSLGPGSIVEVGHVVDEPVELLVNNKLIARGDVVVIDEKFGLRITEIMSQEERIESLS